MTFNWLLTASALELTVVIFTPVSASAAAPCDAPILSNNYSWEAERVNTIP
jgi:hypothetical protein